MKTNLRNLHTCSSRASGILAIVAGLGCASPPNPRGLASLPEPSELPAAPAGSPVARHGQLRVDGTQIRNQAGEPVQLKGVSTMWLNWESRSFSQSRSALRFMRDAWKLSVIRAAMGIEVDGGYLDPDGSGREDMRYALEVVIQNAISEGVYVLVDWHTEKAVDQQAEAVAFFSALATKYGAFPNVIWEPYNEPHGYSWEQIKAYHEAVVDAIRVSDPDNVIVLGTPNWSQFLDVAAQNPVSPMSGAANLAYVLHFYACTHGQQFRAKADVALTKGLAVFVSEFGATPADGGVPPNNLVCRDETNAWFDWMDLHGVSGVGWKLDQCADTSCILKNSAPVQGPFSDNYLTSDVDNTSVRTGVTQGGGHGLFLVDWIRK